jgi:hypothetical protein
MKYLIIVILGVGVGFIGVRGVQIHNSEVNRLKQAENASQCLVLNNDGECNEY